MEVGEIRDYAHASRLLGLTRARLTQVMNLLLLAPEIQRRIALGELALTERALRRVVGAFDWNEQLALIHRIPEEVAADQPTYS